MMSPRLLCRIIHNLCQYFRKKIYCLTFLSFWCKSTCKSSSFWKNVAGCDTTHEGTWAWLCHLNKFLFNGIELVIQNKVHWTTWTQEKRGNSSSLCATFPFENKMNESKQKLIIPCALGWKVVDEYKKSFWEFDFFSTQIFVKFWIRSASTTWSSPAYLGALQTLLAVRLWTAEATFLLSEVCLHRHIIWMKPFSIHNSY